MLYGLESRLLLIVLWQKSFASASTIINEVRAICINWSLRICIAIIADCWAAILLTICVSLVKGEDKEEVRISQGLSV